jgi:hypothetical protein
MVLVHHHIMGINRNERASNRRERHDCNSLISWGNKKGTLLHMTIVVAEGHHD